MRTIPAALQTAMQNGDGLPVARLIYDGSSLGDILEYELHRTSVTVRLPLTSTQIPHAGAFLIRRGVQIGGAEYTIDSPTFYQQGMVIDRASNAVTYHGQILPPSAVNVEDAARAASAVLTDALAAVGISADLPAGGDVWYTWQFDDYNRSLALANIQTLESILKKKYLAALLPRADGLAIGHPGTFDGDEFTGYAPGGFLKQTPLQTVSLQLIATDEIKQTRRIGDATNPSHDIGFLHSDISDTDALQLSTVKTGGDTFEQRPDFRLEHGDSIAAHDDLLGIPCLETVEIFKHSKNPLIWKQIVKPLNFHTALTVSPILHLATPTRIYFDTSADIDPDDSGNPDATTGSAVRIAGDEATLSQRLLPNAYMIDHFDRNTLGIWEWAQDRTPENFTLSFPSLLIVKAGDSPAYLNIPFDDSKRIFFALFSLEKIKYTNYIGIAEIRIESEDRNNFATLSLNQDYIFLTANTYGTPPTTNTYHHQSILFALEVRGNIPGFTLHGYLTSPWSTPIFQTAPNLNLTSQQSWVPKWIGFQILDTTAHIDALGWLKAPTPLFPSAYILTEAGEYLLTEAGEYLLTEEQDD